MEVGTLQVTLEDKQPGTDPNAKPDGAPKEPAQEAAKPKAVLLDMVVPSVKLLVQAAAK